MERGPGVDSIPTSTHYDKTRVLDVKPLRSLLPVFPNGNQCPPFVCAPPFGPFPPGFSPFYPFSPPQANQNTPDVNQTQLPQASFATPLRSFKTPAMANGVAAHQGSSSSKKKARKGHKQDPGASAAVEVGGPGANFDSGISQHDRENGNRDLVVNVLMRFDALRRRLSQLEDAKELSSGIIKRSDLKAGAICMSKGVRTNMKKRVGTVPGVDVGDVFFFRMEMCLAGLHSPSMAGIDYLVIRGELEEEPVATSIVSSGYYDNDEDNPDVLIYTGQGGNGDKDQKLERGNLALERSLQRNSTVRVIRGIKDTAGQNSKIYVYDGLYEIKESWVERGKSGCNTFKYKILRVPGQPAAFAVWKSIQKWKEGMHSRNGLVLPDIASGAESVPVPLVNDIDGDKSPGYFTYFPTVKHLESFRMTRPSSGCDCRSACQPGNLNCSCIRKNGGDFPYTANGVLVCRKPVVYECGPACPCSNCKNKVSQAGLKVHLEVFKTTNRGWGLRSWEPIRSGSFICVYAGEARDKSKMRGDMEDDDYVFDTTHAYTPFKWNYEAGLAEEDASEEISEDFEIPFPLIINAKNVGNVARFMNHSCSPNVFWQPIMYEHNDESFLHIAFFALRHIPPMMELTYDYGISGSPYGKKKCLCGSAKCRGSFG